MPNEHLIAGLKINAKTGLYEISEGRVTYIFDLNMLINLQSYLDQVDLKPNADLINSWYKSLPVRSRLNIFVLLQDLRVNNQKVIL